METNLNDLLIANLLRVFNERDRSKRDEAISELWHQDCVFVDPEGIHRGQTALNAAIDAVHVLFPSFSFSPNSSVQEMNGVGRLSWALGPTDGPPSVHGLDVGVASDGKISSLYAFVD